MGNGLGSFFFFLFFPLDFSNLRVSKLTGCCDAGPLWATGYGIFLMKGDFWRGLGSWQCQLGNGCGRLHITS